MKPASSTPPTLPSMVAVRRSTTTERMDSPPLPFALPLIAILRGITPAEVPAHVGVLVEEGYDAIEIPTNSPDWEHSVRIAVDAFGQRAMIGAGTVLTPASADALVAA